MFILQTKRIINILLLVKWVIIVNIKLSNIVPIVLNLIKFLNAIGFCIYKIYMYII